MAGRTPGVLLALMVCIGCSVDVPSTAPPAQPEPVGVQLIRTHPQLQSERFSDLINFENSSDVVFLRGERLTASIDTDRAHTGSASARIDGGTGSLSIRLGSVMGSRGFPGDWTLAGAWFFSEQPARVRVACTVGGKVAAEQSIHLVPNQWMAALVDVSLLDGADSDATLAFDLAGGGPIWCDDVILIDNTRWLVGGPDAAGWTVRRAGFQYVCAAAGQFTVRLPSDEFFPNGWAVEEVNSIRARLRSSHPQRTVSLYPDGRSYWDGQFRGLSAETKSNPLWSQQSGAPAAVQIPEPMGRLNRTATGDANNDGFDESRGSYSVIATGPRLELQILPRSVPVARPVLEIGGLPPGEPLVTVEGQLIDRLVRLPDGTLLVELPLQFNRPLALNLRIQ